MIGVIYEFSSCLYMCSSMSLSMNGCWFMMVGAVLPLVDEGDANDAICG